MREGVMEGVRGRGSDGGSEGEMGEGVMEGVRGRYEGGSKQLVG